MDNAVATANTTQLVPLNGAALAAAGGNGLAARWSALPGRTQLSAVIGAAALLAVVVFMFSGAKDSNFRPLFSNLSEKDGGQVIDRLTQLNVPYKFAEGGNTILVPAAKVPELRMKLAAGGLPSAGGGGTGYELLDSGTNFGQTQGQERMKMQRAIEGELTRTIQSLEGVKSVRVHLAIPQQNGFFREQLKPSASVVLTLHPGRTLDRGQIAGIVRLVASSVPDLTAKAVSVVDSTGSLLSAAGDDDNSGAGLDSQQLQYRKEVEASHMKRVLALLEPVVGRDNLRASITADIDFSQVMQTAEIYRPNQGADTKAAVREQRSEESNQGGGGNGAGGVPGATSNQPATQATAPITGASQALGPQQNNGGAGAGANGANARREAATRFEVDKTVTVTRSAVGALRRLNAAVVVNHRSTTDAKGKTSTVPLTDKEIEQLTALVQQGIGFNAERGDVVKVVNAPFRVEASTPADDTPIWKQDWLLDLLKTAAAPAALAVVALVIVSKLLRPALTAVLTPPQPAPGSALNEVVDGDGNSLNGGGNGGNGANGANGANGNGANGANGGLGHNGNVPALQGPQSNSAEKLAAARALAKQNPAAVAHIVRGWVNGEAA